MIFSFKQPAKIREQSYLSTHNKDLINRFPLPCSYLSPHHPFLFNSDKTKLLSQEGGGGGRDNQSSVSPQGLVQFQTITISCIDRTNAEQWKACLKRAETPFESPILKVLLLLEEGNLSTSQ